MKRAYINAVIAYVVPTFLIAYFWHLIAFADQYDSLSIYREDLLVPFGFVAVLTQGFFFAWFFAKAFGDGPVLKQGLRYGLSAGVLSWTFTTLAVAAKFPMTSVSDYLFIETGFTIVQFVVVGPLTAFVWQWGRNR